MAKVDVSIDDVKVDPKDWKEWKKNCGDKKCGHHHGHGAGAGGGAVYGLGLIGALIYFWQHATSFWTVVLGFLKAIVWPALFVYHLFGFLKL